MLLFIFTFLSFFIPFQPGVEETIHYRIKPIPAKDRTNLEITVRFKTNNENAVSIKLPTDYYGTPNLHRYVTSFEGLSGTGVEQGKAERERVVKPNREGEINLKYIISYDPTILDGTYSPNVSPNHFHVAGCQWALQIGKDNEERHLDVEITDVPSNWQMYSSLNANALKFEITTSYEDLVASAIGGGLSHNFRQFAHKGMPVSVHIQGKFDIPNNEIFAAIQKIVSLQRDWFKDYNQPFYNVVILPKEENVAGVRILNQFNCFFKRDINRQQLYVLLAHEMFHNWLSTSLIKPQKGENPLRYAWFYEGVNDYFARKILLDANLLSKKEFAYLVNRDIINIADNPHKSTTFAELIEATKTGKYRQAFNKLSYYRGALIALNWENQIRKADKRKNLGNLIQEVYWLASKTNGIDENQFFELAKKYGIDAKSDFEGYILRGEPIKVEPDALENLFKLQESTVPSFDLGFNLDESLAKRKISGLKENSPAFQSGLRNGMELLDGKNLNRFGNAWDPNKPMIIVAKENDSQKRFEFYPRGNPLKLLLYK